ncbi:MAG: hypothetical protein ACR2FV_00640 [Ornithinimicrobium sp.]|uniref:hypothetical protein n=1 Tax=Ornithinimicrobium sp. TaxID=1977084 RepID=UPI003D9B4D51
MAHERRRVGDNFGGDGVALGGELVLNCATLWNPSTSTPPWPPAIRRLPAARPRRARLSPYMRRHLNVHGHYSFQLPQLVGRLAVRSRDPDSPKRTPTDPTGREGVPVPVHPGDLPLVLGASA